MLRNPKTKRLFVASGIRYPEEPSTYCKIVIDVLTGKLTDPRIPLSHFSCFKLSHAVHPVEETDDN